MEDVTTRPVVIPPSAAPAQRVLRARGVRMAVLIGRAEGAPNFITRRFLLAPGAAIPMHLHPTIEHEQVMVRGEMVLGLGKESRTLRAGDAVFIPAGRPHSYRNLGSEEAEFLCVVPATADYATEWLEPPPAGAFLG